MFHCNAGRLAGMDCLGYTETKGEETMHDSDCVDFLQWALPHLRMRWQGFRKVRGQVCKRIALRILNLGLPDIVAYRSWLVAHPQEWSELDGMCRVTVTRFYRDRQVFGTLTREVLPSLAQLARRTEQDKLRCWSIGCASGEAPYTLAILWHELLSFEFSGLRFEVVATDADPQLIERAQRACYPSSALKNLPESLHSKAFCLLGEEYCLRQAYQHAVSFLVQDVRQTLPDGMFDLILCRNLAFTYFDEALQRQITRQLYSKLLPAGWLILGVHEKLPPAQQGFAVVSERLGLYRKE